MDSPYASDSDVSSDPELTNSSQTVASGSRYAGQKCFDDDGMSKNGTMFSPEDMEDVPLDEDEPSEDEDDWVMPYGAEVAAAEAEASTSTQPEHPLDRSDSRDFRFDDADMMSIFLLDGPEEDEPPHILTGYAIPFGPYHPERPHTWKELHPRRAKAIAFADNIPGAQTLRETLSVTTTVAQTNLARSYNGIAGQVEATALTTRQAVDIAGEIGGYLWQGTMNAGRNAAVRVQESWLNWPLPLNRGILATVGELCVEGAQSLPPTDGIIRPRGRH
ncbi:hypothetical protein NW762_008492 [Fusarium torreyae]|uniref:Uncharacterized protein n=1 Tax=Fusarium torreyae TaxID=1237075 RepID=A0A9W8RWK3_9HYPO|nr:hypothetical protein NW762_008492 [Fusarium torreyae]